MTDPRVLLVTKGLDLGGIERVVDRSRTRPRRRGRRRRGRLVNSDRDRLAGAIEAAGVTVHRLDGTDMIGLGAARLAGCTSQPSAPMTSSTSTARCRRRWFGCPPATAELSPRRTRHGDRCGPLTRLAWRATARLDAATIAVSATVAESLPSSVRRRAVVLPHGIDPARIDTALHAAGRNGGGRPSGARDGIVTVVTVASHRDAKNYPNLLRGVRVARRRWCSRPTGHRR